MRAPRRPTGTWRYVPIEDREKPAEQQTVFVLSPLTQAERMAAWDNGQWVHVDTAGNRTIMARGYQLALELCQAHIVDVINLEVSDGNGGWTKATFPKDGTDSERRAFIEQLDDVDVLLIGTELRDKSSVGQAEKN